MKEVWKADFGSDMSFTTSGGNSLVLKSARFDEGIRREEWSASKCATSSGRNIFAIAGFAPTGSYLICTNRIRAMQIRAKQSAYCWDPQTKVRRFSIDEDLILAPRLAIANDKNLLYFCQRRGIAVYSLADGKRQGDILLPGQQTQGVRLHCRRRSCPHSFGSQQRSFPALANVPFRSLADLDFKSGSSPIICLAHRCEMLFALRRHGRKRSIYEMPTGKKTSDAGAGQETRSSGVVHPRRQAGDFGRRR